MKNGRIDSGEQIPRQTSNLVNFAKGFAYVNPTRKQLTYTSDYDYRAIKSGSLSVASDFSTGLSGYQKGTLLAGTQPAGVALLDMKNQNVVREVALEATEGSIVLGLDVVR